MKRKHRSGIYLVFRQWHESYTPIESYLTYEAADEAVGKYNQEFVERGLPACFDVTMLTYYDF